MSGKCRPSLRRKTLEKLELCVKLHQISITDYECVKAAFERLAEYEKNDEVIDNTPCNNIENSRLEIPRLYCCPKCSTVIGGRDNDITQCFKPRCPMCDIVMEEL